MSPTTLTTSLISRLRFESVLRELMTSRRSRSRRQTQPDRSFPSQPPQGRCVLTLRTFGSMVIRQTAQDVCPCAMELLCEPDVTTLTNTEPEWKASLVATVCDGLRPDVSVSSTSDCSKRTRESIKMLLKPQRVHHRRRHRDPALILERLRTSRFGSRRREELMSARVRQLVDPQIQHRLQTGASSRAAHPKSMTHGARIRRGREAYLQARRKLTTRHG